MVYFLRLAESDSSHERMAAMCMMDTIRAKRDEVYAIAKRHKAEKLWFFGSCARGEETPESDRVDHMVAAVESVIH